MPTQPINLFGVNHHVDSSVLATEARLNCYYDIRKGDGGGTIAVLGTPGSYKAPYSFDGNIVYGAQVVNDTMYVVAGAHLYKVASDGTVTLIAANKFAGSWVTMADNSIQVMIVDGTYGWVYTIATNTLTKITDSNFPNGAKSVCCISGRFVVGKPNSREAYMSAILDGLTWTYQGLPLYITKEQHNDLLVAVSAQNGVLILWGSQTMEFWQDAGLSPVPFQNITGTTQSYGLTSFLSPTQLNDTTFFLGFSGQGGLSVYGVKGYTVNKVSTVDVDTELVKWKSSSLALVHGVGFTANGHDFFMLNGYGPTLLLDVTTGLWGHMASGNSNDNSLGTGYDSTHKALGAVVFKHQAVWFGNSTNMYIFNDDTYTDGGQRVQRQVTTKRIRNNGNEFAISELALLMDLGTSPQNTEFQVMMEVSRDGGRTFGSPRPRTMGRIGQYASPRVKWDRLGSAREFVLRFTVTDDTPFIIAGAEIDIVTGG